MYAKQGGLKVNVDKNKVVMVKGEEGSVKKV